VFDDDGRMTDDTLLPFDLPAARRKKLTVDFQGGNQQRRDRFVDESSRADKSLALNSKVSAAAWIMASLRRKRR
jgi:hypothetical protein